MNLNKKRIGLVTAWLISLMIVATVVYVVYAQTAPTFWITEGVYSGAPSCTFEVEGSNYFAKNAYGQMIGSGTNISLITENVINSLTYGGELFFTAGTYEFTGLYNPPNRFAIQVDNNIEIRGEGISKTVFKQADGSNINIMIVSADLGVKKSKNDIKISDLTINCNYLNQDYSSIGFDDYRATGITTYGSFWTVENVEIYNAGMYGGIVSHSRDTKILNNDIHTVYSFDSARRKWTTGIMVSSFVAKRNIITGNFVHDFIDGGSGIHIEDESPDCIISNNIVSNIYSSSNITAEWWYTPTGIWNEGGRTIISDNQVINCTRGIMSRWVTGKPNESGWLAEIQSNIINGSYFEGIVIDSGNNYTLVQNNILINNGYNGSTPYNRQIRIVYSSNIKISENMFLIQGVSTIGFDIDGGANSHNITVNDNEFYGAVAGGGKIVQLNGNDTRIRHNVGFVTENSGSASLATGATVSHGLAGTPTTVLLTISVSEDIWATALGATTFAVNFDGGGTQTVYWLAEYKP